jgi:hypothetical protein
VIERTDLFSGEMCVIDCMAARWKGRGIKI